MFDLLHYNDLDYSQTKNKYKKTLAQLQAGDFKSSDVKKLKGTPYFRAKIDDTHRLLFQPVKCASNKPCLIILEVIPHHRYEKSRFLNGATFDETKQQFSAK